MTTEARTHEWGTQPEMFGPRHEHRLQMFTKETEKLAERSKVLDAAVGLGQLASRLKRQRHVVFGVDASFEAVLHAKRRYGIPTVVGDLTKLPFRTSAFDAVTSGETLEHLDDDRSAIEEIGRVVRDGGSVIVTVPALQSLWTASDDYYEHRRRYSRETLSDHFEKAHFEVRRAKYWGFPIVLTYDTLFLLPMNKRRARSNISEDTALTTVANVGKRKWLVNLVRAIFSIDRIFSFVPFGPGLLLVAQKRAASQR